MMSNMFAKMALLAGLGLAAPVLQSEIVKPAAEPVSAENSRRVVLLGASIGKQWNLPELPQRLNERRYTFEALQAWEYDKSDLVEETLIRPARKFRFTPSYLKGFFRPSPQPADVIILKECSSYFPIDLRRDKELMQQWAQSDAKTLLSCWPLSCRSRVSGRSVIPESKRVFASSMTGCVLMHSSKDCQYSIWKGRCERTTRNVIFGTNSLVVMDHI